MRWSMHASECSIGAHAEGEFLAAAKVTPPRQSRPIPWRTWLARLNYYRLEAGRFKDFVSYGLKSFAHEGVTKTRWSPSPDTIPT